MDVATLSALADPTRLQIVELLREGTFTVGEITDRLQLRQPQASKHLKVLNESQIVEVRPEANRRFYQLRPEPLQEMGSWLQTFHSLWDDRLDRLDDYLQGLQKDHRN